MPTQPMDVGPGLRRTALVLCLTAVGSTPAAAQRGFEGVITMESYVNRQPQPETLSVKGGRWRLDGVESVGPKGGSIVSDDKGQITLWLASRRVYARTPIATDLDEAGNLVTFTKTGKSESVAGSQCDYYKVEFKGQPKGDRQFCVATDLGFVGFAPEVRQHEGLAALGLGAVARRKFTSGFLVLKALDQSGKVVFAVTKIEKRTLGDELFVPPAGWREAPTVGRPPQ